MNGKILINGQWLDQGRERTDVKNPATGGIVGSVPNGTKSDVNDAVEAARQCFSRLVETDRVRTRNSSRKIVCEDA